jgi:hypothetical protein
MSHQDRRTGMKLFIHSPENLHGLKVTIYPNAIEVSGVRGLDAFRGLTVDVSVDGALVLDGSEVGIAKWGGAPPAG